MRIPEIAQIAASPEWRLDVAALGDSDVSRPQDSLNYLVWYAKLMEICIDKDEDPFLVGFPVQ